MSEQRWFVLRLGNGEKRLISKPGTDEECKGEKEGILCVQS